MFIPALKVCLACAGEDNRLHASSETGDDVAKLAQVLRMQDVELLRPVEGDPEGTAPVFRLDIPHVLLLPSAGRIARQPQDALSRTSRSAGTPDSAANVAGAYVLGAADRARDGLASPVVAELCATASALGSPDW